MLKLLIIYVCGLGNGRAAAEQRQRGRTQHYG
jgi:hypothetical protein